MKTIIPVELLQLLLLDRYVDVTKKSRDLKSAAVVRDNVKATECECMYRR